MGMPVETTHRTLDNKVLPDEMSFVIIKKLRFVSGGLPKKENQETKIPSSGGLPKNENPKIPSSGGLPKNENPKIRTTQRFVTSSGGLPKNENPKIPSSGGLPKNGKTQRFHDRIRLGCLGCLPKNGKNQRFVSLGGLPKNDQRFIYTNT
ncbi:TRIO and F-actin-binding protein-like [Rhizophagus irregularis DAOM 181602=DAOM 197198]|nr:TRIO and F-actin-binding protein-like [Rhizophagus irregularis DAOM 181602=DAOM 197198]